MYFNVSTIILKCLDFFNALLSGILAVESCASLSEPTTWITQRTRELSCSSWLMRNTLKDASSRQIDARHCMDWTEWTIHLVLARRMYGFSASFEFRFVYASCFVCPSGLSVMAFTLRVLFGVCCLNNGIISGKNGLLHMLQPHTRFYTRPSLQLRYLITLFDHFTCITYNI